jgi:hypothetical protein
MLTDNRTIGCSLYTEKALIWIVPCAGNVDSSSSCVEQINVRSPSKVLIRLEAFTTVTMMFLMERL